MKKVSKKTVEEMIDKHTQLTAKDLDHTERKFDNNSYNNL